MSIAEKIRRLEDERFEAMLRCDLAVMDRLLDDALIYIHSSAVEEDKAAYVASLRSSDVRYDGFEREGIRVLPLGDEAALVSGRIQIQYMLHGERKRLDNLYIGVWVRRTGGWRMVSWQSTPIPVTQPDSEGRRS